MSRIKNDAAFSSSDSVDCVDFTVNGEQLVLLPVLAREIDKSSGCSSTVSLPGREVDGEEESTAVRFYNATKFAVSCLFT